MQAMNQLTPPYTYEDEVHHSHEEIHTERKVPCYINNDLKDRIFSFYSARRIPPELAEQYPRSILFLGPHSDGSIPPLLSYRSFAEAVTLNPTFQPIDDLSIYCNLCQRAFKMSTKGNLRYILRHEQSIRHSEKLFAILRSHYLPTSPPCDSPLGRSMKLKKKVLEQSFMQHVEQNPLFVLVDSLTVHCKPCKKNLKLDRHRSPRTILLHAESQVHLAKLSKYRAWRSYPIPPVSPPMWCVQRAGT